MPAVSNRSKARSLSSPWHRFNDAVSQRSRCDEADPLELPTSQIEFTLLLEASLHATFAEQHFDEVMANRSSSDLAIFASLAAAHATQHELRKAWHAYQSAGQVERSLAVAA